MTKTKYNPAFNPRHYLHTRIHALEDCPYCQMLGEAIDGYWHHFRCLLTNLEGEDSCEYEDDWSHCELNANATYKNNYRNARNYESKYRIKIGNKRIIYGERNLNEIKAHSVNLSSSNPPA